MVQVPTSEGDVAAMIWDQYTTILDRGFEYYSFNLQEYARTAYREWWRGRRSPLVDILGPVKDALRWFWDTILKPGLEPMFEGVRTVVRTAVGGVESIVDGISSTVGDVWDIVKDLGSTVWDATAGVTTDIYDALGRTVRRVGHGMYQVVDWSMSGLGGFLSGLINTVIDKFGDVADWLGSLYSDITDYLDGVVGTIADTVSSAVSGAIQTIEGFLEEVETAVTDAVMEIPGAIEDAWGRISDVVGELESAITSKISGVLDSLSSIVGEIEDSLSSAIEGTLSTLSSVIDEVESTIVSRIRGIVDTISGAIDEAISTIPDVLSDIVENLEEALMGVVRDLPGKILDPVTSLLDGLHSFISSSIGNVLESVTGALETFGGWVKDALIGVVEAYARGLQEFFGWLWDKIGPWIRDLAGFLNTKIIEPIWNMIKGFAGWVADKVVGVLDWIWDTLMPETSHTPSPELDRIMDYMRSMVALASPVALSTVAGELVHPLKELGLGRLSAIMYELGGFQEISSTLAHTYALITAGYTLRFELMDIVRPMFPREETIIRFLDRNVGTKEEVYDFLHHAGFRDQFNDLLWKWHWDPPEAWKANELVWWNEWSKEDWMHWMNRTGFREDVLDAWWPTIYEVPDEWDLAQMWWRGAIDESEFDDWTLRTGKPPELLDAHKTQLYQYPDVSDLIRFAVRESYSRPELSAGLERQKGLMRDAHQIGLTDHWVEMFWRAHWVLPSPGQLYEMLHREIIDRDVMDQYLRYNDFEPQSRDWLVDISWDLPGKRDIRWMYESGEIGDEEILDLTKKIGIKEEWREKMAAGWRHMLKRSEVNSVVREAREDLEAGWITEEECRERLSDLGIPDKFAGFTIQAALMDRARDLRDDMADALEDLIEDDVIGPSMYREAMIGLGMEPEIVDQKLQVLMLPKQPERILGGPGGS